MIDISNYDNYTTYTSELCHMLKRVGDHDFIRDILKYVDIDSLLQLGRKKHALYTVALIDYISKENNIPLKSELDKYRDMRMEVLSYPSGVETYTRVVNGNDMKEKALTNAIPEFLKYNIVETSIRNII